MKEISNKTEQLFIECACAGEGLLITEFTGLGEKEFWVTMFVAGQFHSKPTIKQRLKFIWYHLKTGKYYDDAIILKPEEAKKLIKFLEKRIEIQLTKE